MPRFMIAAGCSVTMILAKDPLAALIRFFALCILSEEELEQMPGYYPGSFATSNLFGGSVYEWFTNAAKEAPHEHGGTLATLWSGPLRRGTRSTHRVIPKPGTTVLRGWGDGNFYYMPDPYTVENFYNCGFTIVEQPDVVMLSFNDG